MLVLRVFNSLFPIYVNAAEHLVQRDPGSFRSVSLDSIKK